MPLQYRAAVLHAAQKPMSVETVTAAEYGERAARPDLLLEDYPWLQEEWFVDLQGGPSYLY